MPQHRVQEKFWCRTSSQTTKPANMPVNLLGPGGCSRNFGCSKTMHSTLKTQLPVMQWQVEGHRTWRPAGGNGTERNCPASVRKASATRTCRDRKHKHAGKETDNQLIPHLCCLLVPSLLSGSSFSLALSGALGLFFRCTLGVLAGGVPKARFF